MTELFGFLELCRDESIEIDLVFVARGEVCRFESVTGLDEESSMPLYQTREFLDEIDRVVLRAAEFFWGERDILGPEGFEGVDAFGGEAITKLEGSMLIYRLHPANELKSAAAIRYVQKRGGEVVRIPPYRRPE